LLILDCDFDRSRETNGSWLLKRIADSCGASTRIYRAFGPHMLKGFEGYDRVIITGSNASVYEHRNWIARLAGAIRDIDMAGIRTLGICFGHQAVASALGGVVEKGCGEQGFKSIRMTKEGINDPLFGGLSNDFIAYQSHNDYVKSLPRGSVVLASNSSCVQSFRLRNIYGVQFHPEISRDVAERMYRRDNKPILFEGVPDHYRLPEKLVRSFISD
jgi:GMP synthase (glutamine-hydrolysing)